MARKVLGQNGHSPEWVDRVASDWAALIRPARNLIEKEYRRTKALLTD